MGESERYWTRTTVCDLQPQNLRIRVLDFDLTIGTCKPLGTLNINAGGGGGRCD